MVAVGTGIATAYIPSTLEIAVQTVVIQWDFFQKTFSNNNSKLSVSGSPRLNMERNCVGDCEGLTFWLARPEDYEEVMSISEGIYGGNDYLPHRYHDWLREPGRTVLLARSQGKLVALESSLVVDEGSSVVVEGLRVCVSARGRGVAGVIQRFADSYVRQLHPTIKMKRLTRADEELAKYSLLARRAVLSFVGEAGSFNSFICHLKNKLCSAEASSASTASVPEMVPLSEEQVRDVLLDPELPSRVQLPGGAVIQDWQPLRPLEGNLEILARRGLTWLADRREAPAFLGFYTPSYPVPYDGGSMRLNLDLFGTDVTLARRALVGLLARACEKDELKAGTVLVHVYMDTSLWEPLRGFSEGHAGVARHRDYWEQLFMEKEF